MIVMPHEINKATKILDEVAATDYKVDSLEAAHERIDLLCQALSLVIVAVQEIVRDSE